MHASLREFRETGKLSMPGNSRSLDICKRWRTADVSDGGGIRLCVNANVPVSYARAFSAHGNVYSG